MKQILYCPLLIIGPEVLADAAAFPGDWSGHSMLLAVYSIQPRLHCNLADHLVGPQQEQELLDPFSCSTLPKPLYNQPVQLELDSADLRSYLVH